MQFPIGEHALLADSRTAALMAPDGNVAWLCWPWVDSTPLFFSILDAGRGGGFSVRPSRPDARVVSRGYHPRSLVLETKWAVGASRLVVEDALSLGDVPALVRRVRAEGDAVQVAVTVSAAEWPGTAATMRAIGNSLELRGVGGVVVRSPSRWNSTSREVISELSVQPGHAEVVTLGPADAVAPDASIDNTIDAWRSAVPTSIARLQTSTPEASDLYTTAAVLLGLRRRGGGIVAAPTTSLPQWPGSARTWDYRYCWLRDSSLAAVAMLRLGLVEAASSLGAFIGGVVLECGPVPLVRLDGTAPPEETEIAELTGYGGAHPVRIGNAAAGQAQLDVPGEVIDLATSLARESTLPDELAAAVPMLAEWLVTHWREPDHGIWEIRGAPAPYTHSLITAMSGLEGAAALVDRRLVSGDAGAWRQAAAAITTTIRATRGPLELRLDGGGADAALAQAALLGGLDSVAGRIGPTLDLIVERLARGRLVDRYEGQPDTLDDPCAPFVFPTFWLAEALTATGRHGTRWLDAAITTRGPLGLFGEVADPADHSPLGNYPQVQSHAAFVLAAVPPKAAS
jgi:GH15 family glucan-1,4-alpha-glucosidase